MEKEQQSDSTAKAKTKQYTEADYEILIEEYKKKSSNSKPIGVGDVVDKVTEATGVKKLVKAVVGDDCGCEERKRSLNRMFGFYNPMTEEEKKEYVKDLQPLQSGMVMTRDIQVKITTMYSRVFGKRVKPSRCGKCYENYSEDYNEYTNYATNPDGCDIGWICTEEGQVYLVAFCYGREGVTRGDDDRRVNRHVWMVVLSSGRGIFEPG